MNLQELRNKLEQQKGKKQHLENLIEETNEKIRIDTIYLHDAEKAREIMKTIGLMTQKQLQFHISDIASLALEGVFPKPYKLVLDFVERRNKTECDIWFERNGKRIKPLHAAGGGTLDVASFALRIACWSMEMAKSRNTIVLDEPMKWVSAEYQEAVSEIIKQISNKLGIQFIITTHSPVLASYADKIFKVRIKNGISKVIQN
jgi:ABC-type cobalamin/Fe3+-siderophores transport system ATPase subunit